MSEDLRALESWAGALLTKLQPAQRRAINYKVAIDLRRSQAQRIKSQQAPDGAQYASRKKRKELRGKNGRIKRQKAEMFSKIRTARYLKVKASGDQLEVGFVSRVARVARVHQFGEDDRVSSRGPTYSYPARPLLGFSEADRALVRDSLLKHLATA